MGFPAFLVLNYLNIRQFPGHVIDAEENSSSVGKVANGRRSSINFWTPATANSETWIRVDAGSGNTLAPTAFGLDRGHNLAGESIFWESSDSPDSGYSTLSNPTIPTTAGVDGDLDATNGILTDEGAWLKRISAPTARRYLRLRIPAMGTDLKPVIVGAWFGIWWEPGYIFDPLTDEDIELLSSVQETSKGWSGTTREVQRRLGELVFKLPSAAAYAGAATHIRDQFLAGRLMWIVHNDEKTERAVLAKFWPGRAGFRFAPGWGNRQSVVPWREYEPKVRAA